MMQVNISGYAIFCLFGKNIMLGHHWIKNAKKLLFDVFDIILVGRTLAL